MLTTFKDDEFHDISPVVVCDVCGQEINHWRDASSILDNPSPGQISRRPLGLVHKGVCLEHLARERQSEGAFLSREIQDLPGELMKAIGMSITDVIDRELMWLGPLEYEELAEITNRVNGLIERIQELGVDSPLFSRLKHTTEPVGH